MRAEREWQLESHHGSIIPLVPPPSAGEPRAESASLSFSLPGSVSLHTASPFSGAAARARNAERATHLACRAAAKG